MCWSTMAQLGKELVEGKKQAVAPRQSLRLAHHWLPGEVSTAVQVGLGATS